MIYKKKKIEKIKLIKNIINNFGGGATSPPAFYMEDIWKK